ncbi:serine protease [Deinococcus piscis]|uniref:Serine protease n=2 Tax=Deinococcus piscis TaxID=394230 RepID=A0ABQ3K4T9_9DEIO|nr:serine protease [Deinococcus piscis]
MTPPEGAVTLDLGYAEQGRIEKAFAGNWRVEQKPAWLSLTTVKNPADKTLVLDINGVDRNVAVAPDAAQPQLGGVIRIRWQAPGSTEWITSKWTVQARRFVLSGQVQWPEVSGEDATPTPEDVQPPAAGEATQVIVKYRAAAVAQAVGAQLEQVPGTAVGSGLGALSGVQRQAALDSAGRWQRGAAQVAGQLGGQTLLAEAADPEALAALLRQDPAVEYAVVSAPLRSQQAVTSPQALAQPVVPSDQYAPLQWAFRTLGYGAVWRDIEAGGYTRPVTVAVLDSGVRYDHPDLQGQLLTSQEGALDVLGFVPAAPGQSAYDNGDGDGADRDPTDPAFQGRAPQSHGTHVSGIIAARWGEQALSNPKWSPSGVVGAAYRAPVRILPVRVIDALGNTDVAQVVAGIRYAAGQTVTLDGQTFRNPAPVQVMNLSLGGQISAAQAQPMCDAVAEARAAGVLVVAAAGNYSGTTPVYPAACPAALAVGSVTLSGASAPRHSEFSNRFAEVALSAPGGTGLGTTFNGGTLNKTPVPDQIFSTDWDYAKNEPRYAFQAGTSQAAPQVSALAALLLSKGVTAGPADTADRLTATATDLGAAGRDEYFGYGMINPAAALGAPPVSATPGFSLQSDRGQSYQPPLDAEGRFTAYLGAGTFTLRGGIDRSGNGLAGEYGEAGAEVSGTLSAAQPEVQLAPLQLR